jgi:hypothetical protein
MGTKKGKGTPYQSEALLPVIFSPVSYTSKRQDIPYSSEAFFYFINLPISPKSALAPLS